MLKSLIKLFRPNKETYGFFLTLVSIIGAFALAFFKGVDVTGMVPILLASYLGARATEKSVAIVSAARDPNADTRRVINDLEGAPTPDDPDS